jgi:hypothetical protein
MTTDLLAQKEVSLLWATEMGIFMALLELMVSMGW